MGEQLNTQQGVPDVTEVYALLAAPVNEFMVQRIFQTFGIAMSNKVLRIHLLMQTTGGVIGDGIAIYNFIRKLPIEVIAYNGGSVQSIGAIAFLGAQKRKASKTATFMIHRAHFSGGIPASSGQLEAIANALTLDDARMEVILRSHIKMPDSKWEIHNHADLYMTAEEALEDKIIDEITDFAPPLGGTIFNIVGN